MKICAQIVKIYAQLFKNYIPCFYPPPHLPYRSGWNIGEGRQNENLINIVNGEYSTPISPPTTFE